MGRGCGGGAGDTGAGGGGDGLLLSNVFFQNQLYHPP